MMGEGDPPVSLRRLWAGIGAALAGLVVVGYAAIWTVGTVVHWAFGLFE